MKQKKNWKIVFWFPVEKTLSFQYYYWSVLLVKYIHRELSLHHDGIKHCRLISFVIVRISFYQSRFITLCSRFPSNHLSCTLFFFILSSILRTHNFFFVQRKILICQNVDFGNRKKKSNFKFKFTSAMPSCYEYCENHIFSK